MPGPFHIQSISAHTLSRPSCSLVSLLLFVFFFQRQRQPIDIDTVRLDLKTTQVEKATTEQAMTSVQNDLRRLQAMGEDRTRKMRNCRKTMANSANYAFNALLQPQGAQGQLLFNHTDQTLQMVVNPNTRDTERQDAASTVVLSGGERSVTTIAFVMAVGEQVECPFRAIDEFDVFQVSRETKTQTKKNRHTCPSAGHRCHRSSIVALCSPSLFPVLLLPCFRTT